MLFVFIKWMDPGEYLCHSCHISVGVVQKLSDVYYCSHSTQPQSRILSVLSFYCPLFIFLCLCVYCLIINQTHITHVHLLLCITPILKVSVRSLDLFVLVCHHLPVSVVQSRAGVEICLPYLWELWLSLSASLLLFLSM